MRPPNPTETPSDEFLTPSALVTGATRGIGHGIACYLATNGWDLTLAARDSQRLADVQQEVADLGGHAVVAQADMADEDAPHTVVSTHQEAYGTMNALIMAAGVGSAGSLQGYPMRRFDKQLAVNTRAPFALIGQALPLLRAGARESPSRGGRVIALSSIEGVYPEEGLAAYGASKAALISLIKSINVEEGSNGITATAISPAFVATDMSTWVTDRIPAERMITVADVVQVVDLVLRLSPNAVVPQIVINRTGGSPHHA